MKTAVRSASLDEVDTGSRLHELLAERIVASGRGLGSLRCHLLVQPNGYRPAFATRFKALVKDAGAVAHPVKLSPLPRGLWPELISLDLEKGADSAISALAVEAACEDIRSKVLRSGSAHRVCAWLFNDRPAKQVASHLANTAILRLPGSSGRKWLRFYDPLVMDMYWHLLDGRQRGWLMAEFNAWVFVDRWGKVNQLASTEQHPVEQPPRLTPSQWNALSHVAAVNQAWVLALSERLVVDEMRLVETLQAMCQLGKFAVTDKADLELFAFHCLRYGPRFSESEHVRRILKQVDPDAGYAYLVQSLTEADWRRIDSSGQTFARSAEVLGANSHG